MRKLKGFSLIELMVVVSVVAIIATIAYPTFQEQMRKGRRTDCHNALMEIASLQTRFRDEFGSYTTTIAGTFTAGGGLGLSTQSDEGFYTLSAALVGGNNQTFIATCTPTAGAAQVGDSCGNITLDHMGVKNRTGAMGLNQCW